MFVAEVFIAWQLFIANVFLQPVFGCITIKNKKEITNIVTIRKGRSFENKMM